MDHGWLETGLAMAAMAVLALWLCRRLGLPVILAWLGLGLLAGPQGLNWLAPDEIHLVAELGIVFLMFSLGLEFSLPRLWAMRSRVFGLGSLQVLVTGGLAWLIALALGIDLRSALVVGAAIALSSTAIVLKQLDEQGWLNRRHGELSVSILLFQDLAVIPLLIIIPMLGSDSAGTALLVELGWALLKGLAAFAILLWAGGYLLPRLFDEVARSRSEELFVLTTLVVALATGFVTLWLGLSMALGAFLAGMLLGESQYRQQLEADIRPFRDLLMGLFFVSVGMLLDLSLVMDHALLLMGLVLSVVVGKSAVVMGLAVASGEKQKDALATGLCLAQIGEFSFVLIGLALTWQVIDPTLANLLVVTGVISMALAPAFINHCLDLAKRLIGQGHQWTSEQQEQIHLPQEDHALLLGYGRVGQTIARFLRKEGIPYTALDLDPIRVRESRRGGEPVLFGDGRRGEILKQAGIEQAKLVVITFDNRREIFNLLDCIRELAPDCRILVRTRDDDTLMALEQAGADQVIPESLEGSLMLVSQVLYQLGVPLPVILKRLERERRRHYRTLHGFFSGEGRGSELLHGVTLPEGAWAVGRSLSKVSLNHWKVSIEGVQREHDRLEPRDDLVLRPGDTLLLMGASNKLDRAERRLLDGY
ncbi:monovalent cation:proton antiporter family protein [Ferrimonas balearica]|uniref:monovalent cation:proton antiporter family protein n=1 Tax=Ferrimonas balearica TaxID=44012 RepID=UPI001C9930B3|nr:monovalent cation:proton antiporter family protein [Ferrimonas balearica]MBY5921362.1 cation:proton antiporter [Ferrimonas balearica]MBY5995953.1 cation:proton antiporter [Ferrimonas balearica]